jgi:hypothetical protein
MSIHDDQVWDDAFKELMIGVLILLGSFVGAISLFILIFWYFPPLMHWIISS